MGAAAAEADRTLFVGNLETKVTEELLFELFHQVSGWVLLFCLSFSVSPRAWPSGHPFFFSWPSGDPTGGCLGVKGASGLRNTRLVSLSWKILVRLGQK